MKRFSVLLFCFIVFLCGCSMKKDVKVNTALMSFDCYIERENEKYTVNMVTGEEISTITATITKPQNLNGMKYILENGNLSVSYKDIHINPDLKEMPEENAVISVMNVIKDCHNKEAKENDGNYDYNGSLGDNEYCVAVSPAGLPLGISINSLGITVQIKNLTLVK